MQKILKPILIIAMSVLTCLMPMLGYYTIGESWYGALCQMKGRAFSYIATYDVHNIYKRWFYGCSEIRHDYGNHRYMHNPV